MQNTTNTTEPQTAAAPGSALDGNLTLADLNPEEIQTLADEIWLEYDLGLWMKSYSYWLGEPDGSAIRLSIYRKVESVLAAARDIADFKRSLEEKQPESPATSDRPVWWCRCVGDCKTGLTLAQRAEHERTAHPGIEPRRDLDDTPVELRRARHA